MTIARRYQEHGAAALSVLTDRSFFQGELAYLADIKRALPIPVLNKEFMVADIQFYEARAHGADAVLLIVAALERRQLIDFYALAKDLGMDALLETHHERELDTVLEWIPDARLIGINNRDLQTFATDLGVTIRLAKRIPSDKLMVSESGIHRRADVERLLKAGVQAMFIGESLIRAERTEEKLRELLGLGTAQAQQNRRAVSYEDKNLRYHQRRRCGSGGLRRRRRPRVCPVSQKSPSCGARDRPGAGGQTSLRAVRRRVCE